MDRSKWINKDMSVRPKQKLDKNTYEWYNEILLKYNEILLKENRKLIKEVNKLNTRIAELERPVGVAAAEPMRTILEPGSYEDFLWNMREEHINGEA